MCGVYIIYRIFFVYIYIYIYIYIFFFFCLFTLSRKTHQKLSGVIERLGQRNMIERERRETARDQRVERPLRELINEVHNVMSTLSIQS